MQNNSGVTSEMKEFIVPPASYEIQMSACDKHITCEVSGEFVLPDYLPEIKRLLRVNPRVNEASRYLNSGGVQFAGTVDYGVLYTDNDGRLFAAPLSSDYDLECKLEDGGVSISPENVFCDTDIESVVCRPVGPRKLIIKSRLCAHVRAFDNRSIPERTVNAVSAEDEFSLERLRKVYPTAYVARARGEEQYIEGEIPLDGVSGTPKPIFCEASVNVLDASCIGDGVSYRAQINLRSLVESEDGELHIYDKRLPISDTIELSGAERGCDCRVWGKVISVTADAEKIEEEQTPRLCYSLSAVFEAEIQKNISASLTEDAFSTACGCDCNFKDYELPYALRALCTNLSFSHSAALSDTGFSAGCNIVDVCGDAKVDSIERKGSKYVVSGKCRASVVAMDGSPESAELDIPFKCELDGASGDIADFDSTAELVSVRCHVEGENVAFEGEVSLSVALYGKNTVHVVDTLTLDKGTSHATYSSSAIVVCYPGKGDTLWNIAKRYHVPPAKIGRTDADIASPESLVGREYIIFEK